MAAQNLGMKIDTMLSISVNTSKNNVPLSECYVLRQKICKGYCYIPRISLN